MGSIGRRVSPLLYRCWPGTDWSAADTPRSPDALLQLIQHSYNFSGAGLITKLRNWRCIPQCAYRCTEPLQCLFTIADHFDGAFDNGIGIEMRGSTGWK